MKKQYNKRNKKSTGKKDQEALETVTVELPLPIAEILAGVEVEIEELAGRAGMLIIEYAMASEVDRRAGRRYAHMLDRENFRWGTQKGSIVYAGRKVEIDRLKSPGFHRDFEPTVSNVFSDTFSLFSDMISL